MSRASEAAASAVMIEQRMVLGHLRTLVVALGRSGRAVELRTGVTNAQLLVLRQLDDAGPLSINEIARRALTHQSTASLVVSRLERAGLVERRRSGVDARRVLVSITPAGRRVLRDAPSTPTTRLVTALQRLPRTHVRQLGTRLHELSRALGVGGEEDATGLLGPRPAPRARERTAKARARA